MIAIKGMEMPKNCAECPMYNSDVDDYCDITGEWITGEEMIRHPNCPLIEIVTCKDCKYYRSKGDEYSYCTKRIPFASFTECREPNFYCKDAERKE